jgi:hypothetical protein
MRHGIEERLCSQDRHAGKQEACHRWCDPHGGLTSAIMGCRRQARRWKGEAYRGKPMLKAAAASNEATVRT